jgi:hypothetical protein
MVIQWWVAQFDAPRHLFPGAKVGRAGAMSIGHFEWGNVPNVPKLGASWSPVCVAVLCEFVIVCHSLSFYCDDCDGIQWYLVSLVCPWDLNGIYKVFQAVPCSCFCWNALGIGCQKLWCSQRVSRCHCVINRWPWRNRGIAENDHPASIDWDGCKLMQALKSS